LDQIPGDFQNLERVQIEQMIDEMLSEINRNYYESVKKSIVDYVLKDEDERMRIGIIEVIDELPEFGTSVYQGLEPSDEWKEHVNESRERIGQNLVINSKATLSIMRSWH
jgi:dynein heavy chain